VKAASVPTQPAPGKVMSELVQGLLSADHSFKLARTACGIRRPHFWGNALSRPRTFFYALPSMHCYVHLCALRRCTPHALRGCAATLDQLQPGLGPPASPSQNFCNGEPPPAPVAGMVMVCSFSAPSVMTMPLGTMSEG